VLVKCIKVRPLPGKSRRVISHQGSEVADRDYMIPWSQPIYVQPRWVQDLWVTWVSVAGWVRNYPVMFASFELRDASLDLTPLNDLLIKPGCWTVTA
jgi:hypothetical protein